MRRRLTIPASAPTPETETPPDPQAAPQAAEPQPAPQAEPQPAPDLPTTQADQVDMAAVEALFGYQPPAVPLPPPTAFAKCARMAFKSDKGPSAAAVQAALGNVPLGTPYVALPDGSYVNAANCALMQIAEFPYWAIRRFNGEFVENLQVWLTDPGRQPKGAQRIDECVLAVHVVLPGQVPLAQPLQPATVILGTWHNATVKAASLLQRTIEEATKPEWLAVNPSLAAAPPRRRVIGYLQTSMGKSRSSGNPYVKATVYPQPIGLPQMQAFAAWAKSPEGPAALKTASEMFDREVDELKKIADRTTPRN